MSDGERLLLVDASAFITLAAVDAVGLLRGLGGEVAMPEAVEREVVDDPAATALESAADESLGWLRVLDPPDDDHVERARTHLGRDPDGRAGGDVALLAHALAAERPTVLTDDKPLRETCRALSIPVSGSIGVLVRAVERGDATAEEATETLYAMDEVGARLSASLVRRAEDLIAEAAED